MNKKDQYPLFCLLVFIAVFIWAAINPLYPRDWFLESILSIIAVPTLVLTYKKFRFSNTSYTLILIFMILQAIGSHYTYGSVPINLITKMFNFSRNHYDRFVHLMFGVLWYFPILEICRKLIGFKSKFTVYLAPVLIITALGSIFEVLEWLVAIIVEPELGIAYLGTQGDQWDAQKDMVLKIIGSSIAAFIFLKNSKN